MSLINCEECGKEVSSKAPSCPNCGAPIADKQETQAVGAQLQTVQETSKKFKLQSLLSVTLVIVSSIWIIVGSPDANPDTGIPYALLFIGLVWFIVNRIRIWWHHK